MYQTFSETWQFKCRDSRGKTWEEGKSSKKQIYYPSNVRSRQLNTDIRRENSTRFRSKPLFTSFSVRVCACVYTQWFNDESMSFSPLSAQIYISLLCGNAPKQKENQKHFKTKAFFILHCLWRKYMSFLSAIGDEWNMKILWNTFWKVCMSLANLRQLFSFLLVFHTSISRWFFTGVRVTVSLLRSPGVIQVVWPISTVQ